MGKFVKCRHCGNEIHPDWKKCEHCGKSLAFQKLVRPRTFINVFIAIIIVLFVFYVPRHGYEINHHRAAISEIIKITKPIQNHYEIFREPPIVPDQLNIALSGHYQAAGDKDGIGKFSYSWAIKLDKSSYTIKIGPGFNDKQEYSIIFAMKSKNEEAIWDCAGGSLPDVYRPSNCRKP